MLVASPLDCESRILKHRRFETFPCTALGRQAALEYEAQRFSEMAATPESESLIGLFEGSTALKKNRFGKPAKKVRTVQYGARFGPWHRLGAWYGVVSSSDGVCMSDTTSLFRRRKQRHQGSKMRGRHLAPLPNVSLFAVEWRIFWATSVQSKPLNTMQSWWGFLLYLLSALPLVQSKERGGLGIL